jgi:hypothetical protein
MTRVPLPESFLRLPITHRALHDRAAGRIENSPSAIKAAVEAGYGIEVDLQLSSDGVAMVFHDEELDRLTDATGPLNARTAAELGRIPLKGSTDTIPTLAEVLHLIDGKVPLLIEIKDQTLEMAPTDGNLEAATAEALKGYKGDVALMSSTPTPSPAWPALLRTCRGGSPPRLTTPTIGPRCRRRSATAFDRSRTMTPPDPASSATKAATLAASGWPN